MLNRYLANVQTVYLQAGHGQGDPGATFNNVFENTENNKIVTRLARILRYCGVNVMIDPDLNLVNAINYVNQNHPVGTSWCIEIHKDSTGGDISNLRNCMGIYYYGGDADSQAIAEGMITVIRNNGANPLSWARPDTAGRFGRLGWIRDTKPLSHLIECGFIQDDTSDKSEEQYAKWAAQAICSALEKPFKYDLDQVSTPAPSSPTRSDPWSEITNFDKLPNANYYKNSYYNNDWRRILGDIYDRDNEIAYWKQQQALASQKITDLQNQLKQAQSQISQPVTTNNLVSYLKNYDYAGIPFEITQAITNNNLAFILDRFKSINSNYINLLSRDLMLKNLSLDIRDKAQTLYQGF